MPAIEVHDEEQCGAEEYNVDQESLGSPPHCATVDLFSCWLRSLTKIGVVEDVSVAAFHCIRRHVRTLAEFAAKPLGVSSIIYICLAQKESTIDHDRTAALLLDMVCTYLKNANYHKNAVLLIIQFTRPDNVHAHPNAARESSTTSDDRIGHTILS